MWILTFLPDWAIHLILVIGLLGTIAGFVLDIVPFIGRYLLPVRVISLLILSLGVYLQGGLAEKKIQDLQIADMKVKMSKLEAESAKKNIEIQTQVVEKTKVIKQKGDDIIKYVDREVVKKEEVVKFITNCPIPKDIIDAHNAAAEMNKAVEGKK